MMKAVKLTLIVMAAALITFGLSGMANAFHDDGVAYCDGCHTMHDSQDGAQITDSGVGPFLLKGADPSSVCLNCHAAYGQFTADGSGYGSGGDFYWLTREWSWTAHGHDYVSTGDSHGHNVIAADFPGLETGDLVLTTAPGGTYMSAYLGCNSCHDPHGSQGNERLLYGAESETAATYPGDYAFGNPAPIIAVTSRRTNSSPVTDSYHTAFGSGMSAWCANCHTDMLNTGDKSDKHPAGRTLGGTIAGNYGAYVSTDDLTGDPLNCYWEIVPFETGATDPATLDTGSTAGPTASGKVMCATCHRSHASAFPDIGRWYYHATFIVEDSHPQTGDTGASADDVANAYYGRTFTPEQRSLCNRCHIQD
jgi:hypothetical protein